jgi:LPXTG-site transpeptidase (sortase) family protein
MTDARRVRSARHLAAGLLALASLSFGIAAATTAPVDTGPPVDAGAAASTDADGRRADGRGWSSPDAPAPDDLAPSRPDEASSGTPTPPARVVVPGVGIDAALEPVGVDEERRLVVPPPERAGWFDGRPVPGERGPAVLVGHVDSREGPAVFHGLDRVRPGDLIEVVDADGALVRFEVERIEVVEKTDFPTADVYDPVDRAELRLITCGGPFDHETRSYRDNVIVFAFAVAERSAGAS